jgi:DNA-binding NtrC family response regulator
MSRVRSHFNKIELNSGKQINEISNEAMELLMKYPWPGNIRELKSAFELAFVSYSQGMIKPQHLPRIS